MSDTLPYSLAGQLHRYIIMILRGEKNSAMCCRSIRLNPWKRWCVMLFQHWRDEAAPSMSTVRRKCHNLMCLHLMQFPVLACGFPNKSFPCLTEYEPKETVFASWMKRDGWKEMDERYGWGVWESGAIRLIGSGLPQQPEADPGYQTRGSVLFSTLILAFFRLRRITKTLEFYSTLICQKHVLELLCWKKNDMKYVEM